MAASSSAFVAIYEGASERCLIVGCPCPEQAFRIFWSQLRALRGCSRVTLYRENFTETYSVEKGAWKIDWASVKQDGPMTYLLAIILGLDCLLVARPRLEDKKAPVGHTELARIVQERLKNDVLLNGRLKRNPRLLSQLQKARSLNELCKFLNL